MTANKFMVTVEVVPPAGPDADPLLAALEPLAELAFDAFSVATNPVARPRMSAMAFCTLLQQKTGKPVILHCTTRDHNRLSLRWDQDCPGGHGRFRRPGRSRSHDERARSGCV